MKHDEQKWLAHVDLNARPTRIDHLGWQRSRKRPGNVAAGTSGSQDVLRALAHAHQVVCGPLRRGKVEVGELGDRMPGTLVNRATDFATLNVHERDIHISGGNRRGECFVSLA